MGKSDITSEQKENGYRPYGACQKAFQSHAPEVILAGPAGTGKSRSNLEKIYYWCTTCPGTRWAIVRKTRKSLSQTTLVTWEQKVLPAAHPSRGNIRRENRSAYHFPNGSEVALFGFDEPTRLRSGEFDGVLVPECNELTESEWDELNGRTRRLDLNHAGGPPFRQVLGDTNPDSPTHWIMKRFEAGKLKLFHSRHEDNPAIWDHWHQRYTEGGAEYIKRLQNLTGIRRARLFEGRWVKAEGAVYEQYNPALHLVSPFPIPHAWRRYLAIDFGFTNPFVCQWWAEDSDGRLYMYREIYRTQRLVEDHAKDIARYIAEDGVGPSSIICDHDAEDRATLERHLKRGTIPARKDVSPGIQAVSTRLKVSGGHKPRLAFFRDALIEVDPRLQDAKLPLCTVEEFESYVWDVRADKKKETPVKDNDHGMDAVRYMVYHRDGRMAIGDIPTSKPVRTAADELPQEVFARRGGVADVISKPW